jgi:hypothetical protein
MRRVGLALAIVVSVAPALAGIAPPSVACQAAKIWIAGRYVARHARCREPSCGAGWTRRLKHSFAGLEHGPCLTRDDAPRVEIVVGEFEARLAAMLRRRDRACARLFVAAITRLAGVRIRWQRPVWPPRDLRFSDGWRDAYDRFDRDRVAAKALRGCRSVILGPKLTVPATLVQYEIVRALLPPEAATGLRVELPSGWHLHDVAPGSAEFTTFAEYGHGGIMPDGGADLQVYVTDKSVEDWLRVGGDAESSDHMNVADAEAIRVMRSFEVDRSRRLDVLIPRAPTRIGLSFSWYADDAAASQHLNDAEWMLRTARFFPGDDERARPTPASARAAGRDPAPR